MTKVKKLAMNKLMKLIKETPSDNEFLFKLAGLYGSLLSEISKK